MGLAVYPAFGHTSPCTLGWSRDPALGPLEKWKNGRNGGPTRRGRATCSFASPLLDTGGQNGGTVGISTSIAVGH